MIPLLDLKAQYASIRDEVDRAVARTFQSQQFILGPEVDALEREVANFCDCSEAVGVSSGTDALLAAFMAMGIEPGDEIVTTPYSFFATAGSIWRLGAKPVFVDIDPVTFNLIPEAVGRVVTEKTRAILPVHLYGQMADMDPILEVAAKHDLVVIEDAAQAIGAEYKGRRAGSIGHLACFSFFPSKNLGGAGDGGMVTTNDPELARRLRLLRNHGHERMYYNSVVGGNFRLDALQAAVLRVKLNHLQEWTDARRRNADLYRELFAAVAAASVQPPVELPQRRHIYHQFVIRVGGKEEVVPGGVDRSREASGTSRSAGGLRNALVDHLTERQIGCAVYYPVPLHLQECFASLGYQAGDFPNAEEAADQTLALPIYPELTPGQITEIVSAVAEWIPQTVG